MSDEDIQSIIDKANSVPIEAHLSDLVTPGGPDPFSVIALLVRAAEAAPALRADLIKAGEGGRLTEDEKMRLYYGVHILGAARDEASFEPLLRLLHRPADWLDNVFDLAIPESFPRVVAGMFNGDVELLLESVADQFLGQFVRDTLLRAAAFLTWKGRIPGERFKAFLCRFDDERLAESGDQAWEGWVTAITLLGWRDLMWRVDQACADQRLLYVESDYEFYVEDLVKAETEPDDPGRFEDAGVGYIEDILETFHRLALLTVRRSEDDEVNLDDKADAGVVPDPFESMVNPLRHVGRNDPCPCGSGKKAKQCCLN